VLLIRRIRELLYDQGFTINGARNRLDEIVAEPGRAARGPRSNLATLRKEIKSVIEVLRG
jgi:septum formation topological specificity factor MinE